MKKQKNNQVIRTALKEAEIYQWQLAQLLGVAESTMVHYLRRELPKEEQEEIAAKIRQAKKEGVFDV